PEAHEVLVVVPPRLGVQPIVSFHEFARSLRQALFGPSTSADGQDSLWADINEPCISCTGYFTAGYDEEAVGPPVEFAVVHLRRRYHSYMAGHRAGLISVAHEQPPAEGHRVARFGEEIDGRPRLNTLNRHQTNRACIRAAVHRLLLPPRPYEDYHPHPACIRCGDPADWATSCCSMILCAYCLPRELVMSHLRRFCTCKAREEGGLALRPLRRPRDTGTHEPESRWALTRQLLVQVEEEEDDRSFPRDIFLFRTFTSLEDLEGLTPPRRHTDLYHMRMDGTLRRACIIRGAELPFLW
uniref:Uncharacterized protein n=1 Tax=Setaria italica TaxID=4555 RepID=K4AKX5_SETIT